jgi:hypothetical protein
MRTTEYYKPEELPEPEVLTMRQMLDEMEEVHVLAPLVRCSKRKQSSKIKLKYGVMICLT